MAASVRGYCGSVASSSSVALSPPQARLRLRLQPSLCASAPLRVNGRGSVRAQAVLEATEALQLGRREPEAGFLRGAFCKEDEERVVAVETVEGWMRDSITEIVRHIGEAPFLVHLFGGEDGGVTVQREAAGPDSWPEVRRRWGAGEQRRPDGIILVEQVPAGDDEDGSVAPAARRMWGLVVQGRGMERASCYVLDTCRVGSPAGYCTHFLLARAQCFGEPLELQLRKAWLQRIHR